MACFYRGSDKVADQSLSMKHRDGADIILRRNLNEVHTDDSTFLNEAMD